MTDTPEDQIDPDVAANEAVADDIDNFDFARAAMLMGIIEKVATVAVKCTNIGGLAQAALHEMNEEAKDIARRRAEAAAEAQAEIDRLAAEQAKRDAEDNAEEVEVVRRAVPSASTEPTHRDPTPGQPQRRPQDQEKPRGPAAAPTVADNRRL